MVGEGKDRADKRLELLVRVIDEGWSSWNVTMGEVQIHWSIPKDLQLEIVKELSDAESTR